MTNQEALSSMIWFGDIPANLIAKSFIDAGVSSSATYTISQKESIDLIFAALLDILITHPDFTEGKLSIRVDREYLVKKRDEIWDKYGINQNDSSQGAISTDNLM